MESLALPLLASEDVLVDLIEGVDESLECIQELLVLRDYGPRVSTGPVHRGKYLPGLAEQVESLDIWDHLV